MGYYVLSVLLVAFVSLAASQYDSPLPPRFNIPGAIPLGAARNVQINRPQQQVVRIRRPNAIPRPQQIQISTPRYVEPQPTPEQKPVVEEEEEPFIPSILQQQQQQQQGGQRSSEEDSREEDEIQQNIVRYQQPAAPTVRSQIPERFFQTDREVSSNAQRFAPPAERPPQPRQQQFRPQQQQQQQQQQFRPQPQPQQQQIPKRVTPIEQNQNRERKPVSQIIRKWRDENEDGTITWGYENDDGSFKEEFIGIDCVTRGRYGYVDPDGLKREYSYETGILCDPNKRDAEEEEIYEDDKAVLARLEQNNKNKAKKPAAVPQQQQQYYRN